MATDAVLEVAGKRALEAHLVEPRTGVWWADFVFDSPAEPALSGKVTAKIGTIELSGTVDPDFSGSFAVGYRVRIRAGADGWRKVLPAKHYHNDAGVKLATVVKDAAGSVGETIAEVPTTSLGVDWTRVADSASQILALSGLDWWVDRAGVTHVGTRAPTEISVAYETLNYDPASRMVELTSEDLAGIVVGSIVRTKLDTPATIRQLEVSATAGKIRVRAWVSQSTAQEKGGGRVLRALAALVARLTVRTRYHALYRYRVISQVGDRMNLQVVSKASGAPDSLAIGVHPGAAGFKATLTPGAVVLVSFLDGDPSMPVITHYSRPEDPAWLPAAVTLDGTSVKVGPSADMTEVGSGTELVAPGAETKRFVCYGDVIVFPVGQPPVPTGMPILASSPGTPAPGVAPVSVAKAKIP